jgi:hypothetical protein
MSHVIKAGGTFSTHSLEVSFLGVRFQEPDTQSYQARRIGFSEIDCVLLSPSHRLSLQVGKDVLEIPTKADDAGHTAAIDALIDGLQRSVAGTPPPQNLPA